MAGLVSYASSDEDSGDEQPHRQAPAPATQTQTQTQPQPSQPATATAPKPAPINAEPPQQPPAPGAALPPPTGAALGPSLPPMDTSTTPSLPEPSSTAPPSSPYSTARSLIHDLTLPSIPNFDIPPSPPGSPSSSSGTTNAKFETFLSLKKKGTHFNAKLEQSSALRNPALTDKLLQFVDILPPGGGSERGLQYQTTLSEELWNPDAFPAWAFREKLKKGRDKVAREREAARAAPGRSGVEFVSGATTTATTGGGGLSREKRKGGWQ